MLKLKEYLSIISILITIIYFFICCYFTIQLIKTNKIKIIPFTTILVIFWTNLLALIFSNLYFIFVRQKEYLIYFCVLMSISNQFYLLQHLGLLLFLIFERYIKIQSSHQQYRKFIQKFNKFAIYLLNIFASLIFSIISLNWNKIMNKLINKTMLQKEICRITIWQAKYTEGIILIVLHVIFYINAIYCLIKIKKYLNKNKPQSIITNIEHATFHMFRNGHVVSPVCFQIFKLILAILISYTFFQLPTQFVLIFYSFKSKINLVKSGNSLISFILSFLHPLYFMIFAVIFYIFSNINFKNENILKK